MALATSGAKGAEKLAIKWAKQKGVTLVLAKADFDRQWAGGPVPGQRRDAGARSGLRPHPGQFDQFEPGSAACSPFGPALNLAQKAAEKGLRHHPVKARA